MGLHLSEDGHHDNDSFALAYLGVLRNAGQGLRLERLIQQTQGTRRGGVHDGSILC